MRAHKKANARPAIMAAAEQPGEQNGQTEIRALRRRMRPKQKKRNKKMKIKSILQTLVMALTVCLMATSCFGDEEETVTDEYCYISNVTLGSMKRAIHVTTSAGKDSTYYTTFSGANFAMSIDQHKLFIQNLDSLPYGSRVDALPISMGYQGIVVYKQADDEDWHTFSDKDSINFTKPVEFKVFSSSSLSERKYTMKVNVHQVNGDEFQWNQLKSSETLNGLTDRRVVALTDKLVMMARKADGTLACAMRPILAEGEWTVTATTGTEKADPQTLQAIQGSNLLMSTAEGAILQSQNGLDWTELAPAQEGRCLVGASLNHIYALTQGTLQCSGDGGRTWTDNALDEEASRLPQSCLSLTFFHQNNGYDRLVLMGNSTAEHDQKAAVWTKAWRSHVEEPTAQWMYYPHSADNNVLCPQMEPLYTFAYDGGMIALGGKSRNGSHKALQTILQSPDYGLTWRAATGFSTPTELQGTTESFSVTVDRDSYIWIVCGQQTWRGRLNKLGFEK